MIPSWANDVMIAKGIGFETAEVKEAIWGYFELQFSECDWEESLLEKYFGCMIDKLIKNGDVEKARKHFNVTHQPKALGKQTTKRPMRRSQLSQFEEKAQRLLASYDD